MKVKQTARILVADDNEVNRQVVARLLEHWGHEVATASSGREALRAIEDAHFDLIMMDCLMPDMDGFEATRAIRSADGAGFDTEVPIIAITALSTEEDRERCLECGMDDFITKPIDAQDLRRRVERVLQESRGADASQAAGPPGPSVRSPDAAGADTLSGILRSMSGLLIRDAEGWQQDLSEFSKRREWGQVRMVAHRARGVADLLGDTRVSGLAAQIERHAEAGDGRAVNELLDPFRRELRRIVRALKAET